jgi:hypothetical protein
VNDCPFVGGDGVGSVLESGADVVDGGLAIFYIQRGGFEEDVRFGRFEPGANVGDVRGRFQSRGVGGDQLREFEAVRIRVPSQATGGYAGDAECNSVAVPQFGGALGK